MFLFLRRRLVRYLVAAIALPLIGALAVKAGNGLETRRGPTTTSTWLGRIGRFLQKADRRASAPA